MDLAKLHHFAAQCGITLPELNFDSEYHNFSGFPEKNRSDKSEFYRATLHPSGHYTVCFGTFKASMPDLRWVQFNSADGDHTLSQEERERIRLHIEQTEQEAKSQLFERRFLTKERVLKEWQTAGDAEGHEYLKKKQMSSEGLKRALGKTLIDNAIVEVDCLLVPMYDFCGELWNIQRIFFYKGECYKKFYKDGRTSGLYFKYGEGKRKIVAEGIATAYSAWLATGNEVYCAFGTSHLLQLGKAIGGKVDLAADTGDQVVSKRWTEQGLGSVFFPKFIKEHAANADFNDLHLWEGIEKVTEQLAVLELKTQNFSDFMDTEFPPIEYVYENIIKAGSITEVVGTGGAGKSFLTLLLAMHTAMGKSLPPFYITKPKRVLYLDLEMTAPDTQSRAMQMLAGLTPFEQTEKWINEVVPLLKNNMTIYNAQLHPSFDFNLYDPSVQKALDEVIKEHDVIIIDNYRNAKNESCLPHHMSMADRWRIVADYLKKWRNCNKTTFLLNHTNKEGHAQGSSDIVGCICNRIELESAGTDGFCCTIKFTKLRSAKDGVYPAPQIVKWEKHDNWKSPYIWRYNKIKK